MQFLLLPRIPYFTSFLYVILLYQISSKKGMGECITHSKLTSYLVSNSFSLALLHVSILFSADNVKVILHIFLVGYSYHVFV